MKLAEGERKQVEVKCKFRKFEQDERNPSKLVQTLVCFRHEESKFNFQTHILVGLSPSLPLQ